uniref:Uncharacterized protein n=1 Tax=Plectus sambesii TaxID=2011161 RepID=A0A914VSC4_9BILA
MRPRVDISYANRSTNDGDESSADEPDTNPSSGGCCSARLGILSLFYVVRLPA